MSWRRRVRPARGGGYEVHLGQNERRLLADLTVQLVTLLEGVADTAASDLPEALQRLLPPAYTTDAEAERSFESLTRDDLLEHHREALRTISETSEAARLSDDEAAGWLAALNDMRLVLGTLLGATEDETEPPAARSRPAEWLAYLYLGGLQSELVDLLAERLPEPVPGADELVPDDFWGEPPGDLRWDGTPRPKGP